MPFDFATRRSPTQPDTSPRPVLRDTRPGATLDRRTLRRLVAEMID